jgi:GNAT superfamily N-acetyltransferase
MTTVCAVSSTASNTKSSQAGSAARGAGEVVVRRFAISDDVSAITALLHRAYGKQVKLGLRPLAARQDDSVTLRRVTSGECWLAVIRGDDDLNGADRIVGVIILSEREPDAGPAYFSRPGVCSFSQFAVDPALQGAGIGGKLLGHVEQRAVELGCSEIALSMAEPDHALRDYYVRRGYRIVGVWKWPYTNYSSLVMAKRLAQRQG